MHKLVIRRFLKSKSVIQIFILASVVALLTIAPTGFLQGQDQSLRSCTISELSEADLALLKEAYHLQEQLAPHVWSDWNGDSVPLLYKTSDCDYLVNHPAPPPEFIKFQNSPLGGDVWTRSNVDTVGYQATFPINGVFTAVMSSPDDTYSPSLWVLKAMHEFFHIFQHQQNKERLVNPFVGPHADKHELSYPFPYDDQAIKSLMRIEAEEIFRVISGSDTSAIVLRMTPRLLGHVQKVAERVFRDTLDLKYKRWLEWNEGVARFTERELAALATDSALYTPSPEFTNLFPKTSYNDIWETAYANSLNPVRFIGEGVQGRVQFYYLGMGKAYLFNFLDPEWKQKYFRHHLDHLLTK